MASSATLPCEHRLSVIVGTWLTPDTVSSGPTHPRFPSAPEKPNERGATSMECFLMTSLEDKVMVLEFSVPENEPEPYDTDSDLPVLTDVLAFAYRC